jgi:hypothetical protein
MPLNLGRNSIRAPIEIHLAPNALQGKMAARRTDLDVLQYTLSRI